MILYYMILYYIIYFIYHIFFKLIDILDSMYVYIIECIVHFVFSNTFIIVH